MLLTSIIEDLYCTKKSLKCKYSSQRFLSVHLTTLIIYKVFSNKATLKVKNSEHNYFLFIFQLRILIPNGFNEHFFMTNPFMCLLLTCFLQKPHSLTHNINTHTPPPPHNLPTCSDEELMLKTTAAQTCSGAILQPSSTSLVCQSSPTFSQKLISFFNFNLYPRMYFLDTREL